MSTLNRTNIRYFQTAVDDLSVERTESGSAIIRAFPVFRAGTFRDSMGEQHTWEVEHLQQMIFNFGLLKNRKILPNVPVRDGHRSLFGGGGEVVGYVEDLYTLDGYEDGYVRLVADLEITEPEAYEKIERGTWRSRSAEIGFYETNDEVMYWPVFMGVAFVDIPAVEGLYEKASDVKFTSLTDDKEGAAVPDKKKEEGAPTPPATEEPTPATPPVTPEDTEEHEEEEPGTSEHGRSTPPTTPPTPPSDPGTPTPTPPTTPPPPAGVFRIRGQETTDFAAVQSYIDTLENVVKDQTEQNRRDFVTGLAEHGRIAATQVDGMTAHALSLSDSQYEAFKEMWEAAPEVPLFANHGQTPTNPDGSKGPSEIDTLRETLEYHRRSGLPEDKIKETGSYKRLMSLTNGEG